MCHNLASDSKTNRLHECYLRVIFSDKASLFEALLQKDGSVSIYNRNPQVFAIEMYKTSKAYLRQL